MTVFRRLLIFHPGLMWQVAGRTPGKMAPVKMHAASAKGSAASTLATRSTLWRLPRLGPRARQQRFGHF